MLFNPCKLSHLSRHQYSYRVPANPSWLSSSPFLLAVSSMAITISLLSGLLVEFYLYSIYTLLFSFTLYTLFQKIRKNRTNQCLAFAVIVMYLVATASTLLHAISLVSVTTTPYITEAFLSWFLTLENSAQSLPCINATFGDAIVIWRVWVVWGRAWRAVIGPILLLLGTLAVILAQLILGNRHGYLEQAAESLVYSKTLLRLNVAGYALTLATNAMATALIAYRAWLHYRSSSTVRIRIGRDRTLAVLLLLVESGAIYCVIWIADIVLWTLPASTVGGSFDFLVPLIPQLMTMYPTVIVVLCAMQRSYTDTITLEKSDDLLPTAYRSPNHPGSRI
ncbi:hypothetical protein FA95DRAFT_473983 [Auriscalpium vulgare]|uniref:Uncharacterized protein n=1 Tax=Auriscalpium vulgare TaxID=40419 RepID=A0ACB8SCU0_9AGAM|nr:hypothetical protein FA95DRAFT_473983 [Auriscalpium vulgare]